ncbi:MAG: DUF3365 domain-containing protein [Calditrichaeota bacterium]|nr:MAG: DUF3365 domain-containing protein [Calditrichota bacterium]MBL1206385.1 DUF3365 domain-containing protein [Calditrichota bacterium]NOG46211.1 DUF3365 domain-containing protein [Calditrichota bacterium]
MRRAFFFIGIIAFTFISISALSKKDNKALLEELKSSAMSQIENHQTLFNTNKDGSVTDKGISPAWFGKASYKQFKTMSKGMEWKVKHLSNNYEVGQLGEALSIYLAAARIVVARSQKKINTDSDGTANPKHFYPAVFGRLTAQEFQKRTGIDIKQTTTGKGMGARNKQYNSPDSWEKMALQKFESNDLSRAIGFGENVTESGENYYRFMYPLEIKKACLSCHGAPRGSKDISGHVREGYELHDVRGGISVKITTSEFLVNHGK